MNKKKMRKYMVMWTWGTAGFFSFAPLFGWSTISYDPTSISCTVDLMNPDFAYFSYIIVCFLVVYLVPFVLLFAFRSKLRQNDHEMLPSARTVSAGTNAIRSRVSKLNLTRIDFHHHV